MITRTRISLALVTALTVAAALVPAAPAAGEPKNQAPFLVAMSGAPVASEPKNEARFVTTATRRSEGTRLSHTSRVAAGEAKNQTPFIRGSVPRAPEGGTTSVAPAG